MRRFRRGGMGVQLLVEALAREVDRIAEIPNSLRQGTFVSLREVAIA